MIYNIGINVLLYCGYINNVILQGLRIVYLIFNDVYSKTTIYSETIVELYSGIPLSFEIPIQQAWPAPSSFRSTHYP